MVDPLWAVCDERDVAYCLGAQAYAKEPVRCPGRMSRFPGHPTDGVRDSDAGS